MHLRSLRLSIRNLHIQRPHLIPGIWQADWAPTGRVTSWWLQISSVSSLLGRKLSSRPPWSAWGTLVLIFPLEVGGWWGWYQEVITLSLTQLDIQKSDISSPVSPTPRGLKPGKQKTPNAILSEVPLKTYFKFRYDLTLNVKPIFSVFKNCTKRDAWLWVERWTASALEHSHHASFSFMFGWLSCILEALLHSSCQGSDCSMHLGHASMCPPKPMYWNLNSSVRQEAFRENP